MPLTARALCCSLPACSAFPRPVCSSGDQLRSVLCSYDFFQISLLLEKDKQTNKQKTHKTLGIVRSSKMNALNVENQMPILVILQVSCAIQCLKEKITCLIAIKVR